MLSQSHENYDFMKIKISLKMKRSKKTTWKKTSWVKWALMFSPVTSINAWESSNEPFKLCFIEVLFTNNQVFAINNSTNESVKQLNAGMGRKRACYITIVKALTCWTQQLQTLIHGSIAPTCRRTGSTTRDNPVRITWNCGSTLSVK